ncbi:hypothetical protein EV207_101150 [Scopulibacillus darangshiensis]|uniref:Uncharacterized protein n=1 Tax=Scopulibacillus darangshiensis TaxID=442528 RepID=A0A4R2PAZ5_9BACL|nr:hypothetical protein [Scopulibacillus darangshiensis]TCP32172.1 hypothetical protein EV207_101150 [Scopulibacillus darangshiensis]
MMMNRKNHDTFVQIGNLLEKRRELHEKGKDLTEIEAELLTLGNTLWNKPYVPKVIKKKRIFLDTEKIISMYKEGYTSQELANHFKCHVTSIRNHLRKNFPDYNETANRGRTKDKRVDKNEVVRLRNKGVSARELSEKFKCDIAYIYRIVKKHKESVG